MLHHQTNQSNQNQSKKSKFNKLIDSFQSLKLCNKHFNHHQQPTTLLGKPNQPISSLPSPPTIALNDNPSITFPVPEPFKHSSSSPLVQSTPHKLQPHHTPSSATLSPPISRPPPSQKPSTPSQKPSTPSQKPPTPNRPATTKPQIQTPCATPTKPSTPSSAIASPTTRCCGTTREGKPCSRKPMKTIQPNPSHPPINLSQNLDHLDLILASSLPPTPTLLTSDPRVPRFCFQHYQKANAQSGAYFGKSIWIEFSDWFAPELPEDVKITLKTEMSKQPTEKDKIEYGYLYCHEMGRSGGQTVKGGGTYIKVGRSTRPVARLGEWSKQCPSRTPIVRGFFPEFSSENQPDSGNQSACYLDGIQTVSPKGIRFHRKWERLALIELAGWAFLQRHGSPKLPCLDCSKVHLELFELDPGSYERLVKPLILKWQKWCQFAYL